jgi:hypothetical protein
MARRNEARLAAEVVDDVIQPQLDHERHYEAKDRDRNEGFLLSARDEAIHEGQSTPQPGGLVRSLRLAFYLAGFTIA